MVKKTVKATKYRMLFSKRKSIISFYVSKKLLQTLSFFLNFAADNPEKKKTCSAKMGDRSKSTVSAFAILFSSIQTLSSVKH